MTIEFQEWPKTARHYRDITITEKIDGTNAAIGIIPIEEVNHVIGADISKPYLLTDISVLDENVFAKVKRAGEPQIYGVYAQSRNRLIRPGKATDNAGFAGWVAQNAAQLVELLNPGLHYGEWWGQGIQRNYGLKEKRFSLFNTHAHRGIYERSNGLLRSVPVLYQGPNQGARVEEAMQYLAEYGSEAETGFANPEGVCVYHSASKQVTKVTFEHDNTGKWAA